MTSKLRLQLLQMYTKDTTRTFCSRSWRTHFIIFRRKNRVKAELPVMISPGLLWDSTLVRCLGCGWADGHKKGTPFILTSVDHGGSWWIMVSQGVKETTIESLDWNSLKPRWRRMLNVVFASRFLKVSTYLVGLWIKFPRTSFRPRWNFLSKGFQRFAESMQT